MSDIKNNGVVSIIVPIYNAEKYIGRAIDSIINQTYANFELILIDDGSSDSSLSICRQYAENDSRITVHTQPNAGPSSARNAGLQRVTGDYLVFVDADDTLESYALECLVKKMMLTQADVCIYGWNTVLPKGSKKKHCFEEKEVLKEPQEFFSKVFWKHAYCGGGYPWNKIWKVSSIKFNDQFILFDQSIRLYEDFLWTVENFERVLKVEYEERTLYSYYLLNESLSRRGNNLKRREQFFLGAQKVYNYIAQNHVFCCKEAMAWYRVRLVNYLFEKKKCGLALSKDEKKDLRNVPILPMKHDEAINWMKFFIKRVIIAF